MKQHKEAYPSPHPIAHEKWWNRISLLIAALLYPFVMILFFMWIIGLGIFTKSVQAIRRGGRTEPADKQEDSK